MHGTACLQHGELLHIHATACPHVSKNAFGSSIMFLCCLIACCSLFWEAHGPEVENLSSFFTAVPNLGRRLRIASPCIGVHACGYALDYMHVPYDTINAYDLEASYKNTLTEHLKRAGQDVISLHLGRSMGDIMSAMLTKLEAPVDFLVAGPPCPPFSGQGNKKGRRSKPHTTNRFRSPYLSTRPISILRKHETNM